MPGTILLVAGHPGVRSALVERLAPAGTPWVVQATATLEAAVQAVRERCPAVILCVPTGLTPRDDASAVVRRLSRLDVPLVVLAPTLRAGEETALRQAGARAVLLQGLPLPTVRAALARAASPCGADADPVEEEEEEEAG